MGREHLEEAFAAWSDAKGLKTRDIDRRRVFRDLFALAGPRIEEAHIDELSKKYRQGLMGARAVLAARQVSAEIIEWQEETGPAEVEAEPLKAPSNDPRSDDRIPEAPRRGSTAPSRPPSKPPPSPSVPAPAAPQANLVSHDYWAEVGKSAPPPPLDERLLQVNKETTSKALGYDRRPSTKPPSTGLSMEESLHGISEERRKLRRLENLEENIDASLGTPSSIPPRASESMRPALSDRPLSYRPPSMRPPSIKPSAYPPGGTLFQSSAHVPPPEVRTIVSRRVLIGAGALLAVPILSFLLKWPNFIYADEAKPVAGVFTSKHLGVAWDFGGPWKHAEHLDDSAGIPEGERRVSVFFRGSAHNAFSSQLTVVVFDGEQPLNAENARKLCANETMGTVQMRRCDPFNLGAIEGLRCGALGSFFGKPVAVLEYYFSMSGKAVFFRYLASMLAVVPPMGGDPQLMQHAQVEQERRMEEMIGSAETILKTMRAVP